MTLRLQTPHAPDMLELSRVFARTLHVPSPARHFPLWAGGDDDAASIVSAATAPQYVRLRKSLYCAVNLSLQNFLMNSVRTGGGSPVQACHLDVCVYFSDENSLSKVLFRTTLFQFFDVLLCFRFLVHGSVYL